MASILIVDDNPDNLKLMVFVLAKAGFRVRTAADAEKALDLVRSERPELILMDVQLPGMDGLALTRVLKAGPETRDILIVAVTAYAMKSDEQRAFAAGCDGYVSKPIDTRTLPGIVRDYLSRAAVS
jgi:CheY-like chemotaxis protein